MKDSAALAASRLGDLPSTGLDLSTKRGQETHDAIMLFMRGVERQRAWLLQIVIGGRVQWHKIAGQVWSVNSGQRALHITRDLLDQMFDYFVRQAGPDPEQQLETLQLVEKWSPAQRTGLLPKVQPAPFKRSDAEVRDLIAKVEHFNRYGR